MGPTLGALRTGDTVKGDRHLPERWYLMTSEALQNLSPKLCGNCQSTIAIEMARRAKGKGYEPNAPEPVTP